MNVLALENEAVNQHFVTQAEVLRALNIDEARVRAEESAMRDYVVATTNDRRVLGSMNDFANMLDAYLHDRSLTETALHLAEAPCSPLAIRTHGRSPSPSFRRQPCAW